MSFNLYFAGSQSIGIDEYMMYKDVKRLFSYANECNALKQWNSDGFGPNLLCDSGAYSVAHQGIKVDIDEYINFINQNYTIANFIELDVIPYPTLTNDIAQECSDKSWNNYIYMKQRITSQANILPVYHFGESVECLQRILNTPINNKLADYICIGGIRGTLDIQKQYYNYIFSVIKSSDNPDVKVHVLGMTVLNLLEQFPFYSADSTTWLQLGVNGNIITDNGIIIMSDRQQNNKMHFNHCSKHLKQKVETEIITKGYTVQGLMSNYKERLKFNIDYLQDWAERYVYRGPSDFIDNSLI